MSESVESSSSGDSSTSADTPQGPLSVLLQMVLKSAQAEAEQSSATPPEAFTIPLRVSFYSWDLAIANEQDISTYSQVSKRTPVQMYPQRSQEELKLCGIKDPTTASDSEVIISRDFFIFLLGHADGDRIAPFLNNRHYRFQFVDDNWFRISPELYNMEVSTIMDQHIRATIRHSILEEATKASTASRPSTEDSTPKSTSTRSTQQKNTVTQSRQYLRKTCSHVTFSPKQSSHVWTKEEDVLLENAVKQYGYKHWKEIAQEVGTRNAVQCRQRYFTLHRSHRVGRWSEEENRILLDCVKQNMEIPEIMKCIPRSVKQIKDRLEILSCSHAEWTEQEVNYLFQLVEQFGFRWSMFTSYFPNRTAGRIKDKYWSERRKRERKDSS
ncbi:Myb-like DNA-binding protein [Blastocystis sp. subtype 4]|uniref:Myb-like DNA-binding protein n=1 Tax=Blastocystis sp. subtype 4 TaxID=944170 RepID=UPI000711933A|nr:Myb-like DNA-binding protein [Blastocystis sp. subtype 4]KNB46233.1 Myb-like DNA-binding protein [Blastocystis sp. subtype 4]|eukprot:XP_014529675.1 Myb-like DNA-binding protein [Blastocystis sp. subtype 4]